MPRDDQPPVSVEQSLFGRLGAHTRWAQCEDRTAATERARQASADRFLRLVDPDGTLAPEERAKRAESARKAHMTRMALASARARRKEVSHGQS